MINYIVYWQHDTPTGGHYGNFRECNIIYVQHMSINNIYFIYIFREKPALQEFMIEIVRVVEQFQLCLKAQLGCLCIGLSPLLAYQKKKQLSNVSFQKRMLNITYV